MVEAEFSGKSRVTSFGRQLLLLVLQILLSIAVLILIGSLPVFINGFQFDPAGYAEKTAEIAMQLLMLHEMTYEGVPMVPIIAERAGITIPIFLGGVAAAFFFSFVTAYAALMLMRKNLKKITKLLGILEAVPDVMIFVLLQIGVIAFLKATGIKLAQFATTGSENQAVLLPILCIALPVSFFLSKMLIQYITEELDKSYIELVRSMGFSYSYILNMHVMRNIAGALFGSAKTVFWSMLSTMAVVEYLFNLNGLLSFVFIASTPEVFTLSCITLFIPLFILYRVFERISSSIRKETQ
ncbi:ABC transporter permease subunit [Metabacillus indicus]|uniref:ABC transporter permease subunit n=1 Tax=Metabacillus indicus TaxID=246786 RepID=UPI00049308EC|nr:ABC transporter permease subunit [Metabacillus indicus]KEZ48605.1 hypothetical protein AZ46_0217010 [Metabacillus indicus LMG 22858]